MSLKVQLACTIKSVRSQSGMSKEQLASKAGISTRFYQDIEAEVKQPNIDTVFKLAKALGVDFTTLLSPVWKRWLAENKDKS